MPSIIDKEFQDVQIYVDFSKEIAGQTRLPDNILYANLEDEGSSLNSNIAVSLAKIYTWFNDIATFTPSSSSHKISIKTSALPPVGSTYAFQEGSISGAFQVQEDGGEWQTIAVHNAGVSISNGDGLTSTEPPDKIYLMNGSNTSLANITIGLLDPVIDIFIIINSMKMINIQHLLLQNREKYMLISQTMMHIDGEEQHTF